MIAVKFIASKWNPTRVLGIDSINGRCIGGSLINRKSQKMAIASGIRFINNRSIGIRVIRVKMLGASWIDPAPEHDFLYY